MTARYASHPVQTLLTTFVAWKAVLLAIAAGTRVGTPYDTSSALLLGDDVAQSQPNLVSRLLSWDAVFFVQVARHGYRFEQEWAFGYGLPSLISLWKALVDLVWDGDLLSEAVVGVGVAHVSHLLSVLVLYRLGKLVWGDRRLAFLAACLHIFSPAGLFLSTPYAESTFSLLSFVGYYVLALGFLAERPSLYANMLQLLAGVIFGLATVFRSNGILNGLPFALEAIREGLRFLQCPKQTTFQRLVFLGLGGLCVAAGSILPQLVAYQRFCTGGGPDADLRAWCTRPFPSIYAFVQKFYWNVGWFEYWGMNNLPMFILAAPMTFLLIRAGLEILAERPGSPAAVDDSKVNGNSKSHGASHSNSNGGGGSVSSNGNSSTNTNTSSACIDGDRLLVLVKYMAASQVLLALLAITTYHIQIITRISSGYPVWYWWLARMLVDDPKSRLGSVTVVFLIMYASIQAALFAFFLPPA